MSLRVSYLVSFLIFFLFESKGSCGIQYPTRDSIRVIELVEKSKRFEDFNKDSSLILIQKAKVIAKEQSSDWLISLVRDREGVLLRDLGFWEEAVKCFDEAIEKFLKGGYTREAGQVYLHLGNLYCREGEMHELRSAFDLSDSSFIRALNSYEKALEYISKTGDTLWLAHSYMNIGGIRYKQFLDDAALKNYKKAAYYFDKVGDEKHVSSLNSNIGLVYKSRGDLDSAAFFYFKARGDFVLQGNLANWISVNLNLATVHEKQSPEQAIFYLKEADSLALIVGENVQRAIIQEYLYKIYTSLGETDKALMYLENYVALKDSLLNSDFKLEELNARYESRKQQELIEQQRNESLLKELALSRVRSERQALWIGFSFLLMLIGVLGGVWWYRKRTTTLIQKQKEKISIQRIEQLKKEQEVKTIEALLQGQEKERGRISEDLHDRLGSTLSAVRMQIEAYGYENDLSVEKLLKLVDRAIEETRSISHNLVSGVLSRFGLVAALEELQENFNVSQRVKIHLQSCELTDFDSTLEVELFRVIQELVNNALKHSLAKNVWVKLDVKEEWLLLVVRDDGVGFDINQPNYGMGLSNIKTRVARLNGVLDVKSHLGGGASFEIQIPLSNETNKYSYC